MKKMRYIAASALAATLLFTGCNEEDNRVTNAYADGSGPLTEIKIPTVTFSGVLKDKNGQPIVSHTVFIDDINATTDSNGIFMLTGVKVKAGVDLGNADTAGMNTVLEGSNSGTTTVTIVIPDVTSGSNTTHLGLTATISVDDYLAGVYNSEKQNFYTILDGKVISTGVIQLAQLDAKVSGRLEMKGSEAPVGGEMYMTISPNDAGNGNVVTNADNNLTILTNNQTVFTATADANGNFTATGLPRSTTMKLQVSGYDVNASAFTTQENNGTLRVEIALNPISIGDNGAPQFSYLVGAYGDGNYTTGSTTQVGTFIRPSNALTLAFSEELNTSNVTTDSIRYVKTYTDEYLTAWELVNQAEMAKANALNLHLANISDFRDAKATFDNYLNTHSGNDMNISSATFKASYNTYLSALKTLVQDANSTYGNDELAALGLTYYNVPAIYSAAPNNAAISNFVYDANASAGAAYSLGPISPIRSIRSSRWSCYCLKLS